ncbi:MAG: twin-arginine translocase subunit TatC [Alphaproteobacteria bacterium]|nr:twin-arginine translocase subunit TatC [Alphaproteobacteria bacterium]
MSGRKMEKLKQMPLFDHIAELRSRIIAAGTFFLVAVALCYTFRYEIYNFMVAPLAKALVANGLKPELIFTSPAEAFTSMLGLVFRAALLFSAPFFVAQAWLYVSPALYKSEKRPALIYAVAAMILFLAGAVFAYMLVLPVALRFLSGFVDGAGLAAPLVPQMKIAEYFSFAVAMMFAFGICFITPVLLVFMVRFGAVRNATLRAGRKYWVLFAFVIGAILTPPDVASQVMLALPLIAMYEAAILITRRHG